MNRLIVILAISAIGLLASFRDAFYGLLLYAFWSFAHPLELVPWIPLGEYRLSYIIAVVVIVTAVMQRKKIMLPHRLTFLCILFLSQCFFSEIEARYFPTYSEFLLRMLIMTFITSALIENTHKFKMYLVAVTACLGFFGAYYGFTGILFGNIAVSMQGGSGIIGNCKGDNNHYALWLNMGLPFVWYLGANLKKAYWRYIFKVVFIGNIIAVILTFSRAGFLSLVLILPLIFLRKKALFLVIPVIVGISLFLLMQPLRVSQPEYIPQEDIAGQTMSLYKQRLGTMSEGPMQVYTAQARVNFWKTAIAMANANPLFGVGFQRHFYEYDRYDVSHGKFGIGRRAIHNTFLSILGGTGYPGFLLFILIIFGYFTTLRKSKKLIIENLSGNEKEEFSSYVRMLYIAMFAFMINGSFVDEPNSEIFWMIIGLVIALEHIIKNVSLERAGQEEGSLK
jgi:probable O-glycosylation ligase (exosortase A-associated)